MKYKEVVKNLSILKLDKIANCLSEYIDKVNTEKIPFLDALYDITKMEIENKAQRASEFNIGIAIFHIIELLMISIFLFSHQLIKNKSLN